jgi:hypothetical protein
MVRVHKQRLGVLTTVLDINSRPSGAAIMAICEPEHFPSLLFIVNNQKRFDLRIHLVTWDDDVKWSIVYGSSFGTGDMLEPMVESWFRFQKLETVAFPTKRKHIQTNQTNQTNLVKISIQRIRHG